jgi:hypothetical protein
MLDVIGTVVVLDLATCGWLGEGMVRVRVSMAVASRGVER